VADVSTYIASGNVLCSVTGRTSALKDLLERVLCDEFDVTTTVVVRSREQLQRARDAYPFDVHQPKLCAISFLAAKPGAAAVERLADADFGDDTCAVVGSDLHLRYATAVHNSTMTPARMGRLLGVGGTARNLLTVEKLIDLLA
jgi:uncharacterized protein (DUF1697 family)